MGHLFLQFLGQRKLRKESGYFIQEFSLDINYWSRSVEWPLKFCSQRFLISLCSNMGHLFLQFLRQRKLRKESGYFIQEFSLDINYWSRSVEWPLKFCSQRFLISLCSNMGHLFLQFLRQRKLRKESGYFTREFSLDINYWSRFVEWPLKFCSQRFLISSVSGYSWELARTLLIWLAFKL